MNDLFDQLGNIGMGMVLIGFGLIVFSLGLACFAVAVWWTFGLWTGNVNLQ
jgi:hypothetical protein